MGFPVIGLPETGLVEKASAGVLGCAISAYFAGATDYSLFLCGAAGALISLLLLAGLNNREIRMVAARRQRRG